jgi:hypothetical protein
MVSQTTQNRSKLSKIHFVVILSRFIKMVLDLYIDHEHLEQALEILTVLSNVAVRLFAKQGESSIAHSRREFAYHFD